MKKMINEEHIEGYVYQHKLEKKTVQTQTSANFGKEFISGTVDIATDEEAMNIVQIHYTYVTPTTKNGAANRTFNVLNQLMTAPTWIENGKDAAVKVSADTALGLNEFYSREGDLVSQKVNEGGFISIISQFSNNKRDFFSTDILIRAITRVEANPEKHIDKDYVRVSGAIFNFRNDLLPVDFKVDDERGMEYFLSLEVSPSQPIFTKVWGKITSGTVTIPTTEESAWGEACVNNYERKTREWVITGTIKEPYNFGDANILTQEEVIKAQQDREVRLAEIKKRADEYQAQKAATPAAGFPATGATPAPAPTGAPSAVVNTGDFKF